MVKYYTHELLKTNNNKILRLIVVSLIYTNYNEYNMLGKIILLTNKQTFNKILTAQIVREPYLYKPHYVYLTLIYSIITSASLGKLQQDLCYKTIKTGVIKRNQG